MIAALLLTLQVTTPPAPADTVPAADTLSRVTLEEAIRRSAQLDPDYVQALGTIDNAEWGRRAAMLAFFVPSLSLGLDETKYSTEFFNPADPANPTSTLVVGSARANYEVFSLRKFAELGRTRAEVASAEAGELEQRFLAALEAESSYYDVLVNQELTRVSQERVGRAREGLGVARARVVSGAAVQTDSLQLVLEVTRAEVDLLRQGNALRTAQLELGRRVGAPGAVDAVPLDTMPAPELPIGLPEALSAALDQGPQYRAARANERAAAAALKSQRSDYLPSLNVGALHQRYDTRIFPGAANVSSVTFSLSFPIWNNGQREIGVSQARVARDVARTIREDLERVVRRDVTSAFDTYQTSRAAVALARVGVQVGRENYRMQDIRYRAGASTILDLLDAQVEPGAGRGRPGRGEIRDPIGAGAAGGDTGPQTLLEQGRTVRRILAVVALGIAGCNSADGAPKDGAPGGGEGGGPPAMPVEVVVARSDTVVDAILATGQIEAVQSIELRSDIEGRVAAILVREGTVVSRGRALIKIDDAELKAEVARAEAERDLARQSLSRTRELLSQKASSQSELERAEATTRSTEAQYQLLKVRLDRTTVRAPFSGVTGRRLVSLGDYVTTSDGADDPADRVAPAGGVPSTGALCRPARGRPARHLPGGRPPRPGIRGTGGFRGPRGAAAGTDHNGQGSGAEPAPQAAVRHVHRNPARDRGASQCGGDRRRRGAAAAGCELRLGHQRREGHPPLGRAGRPDAGLRRGANRGRGGRAGRGRGPGAAG